MGAPRRWIKQFLGLKKSEKMVSSEEEKGSGSDVKQSVVIDKVRYEDTEFEDANWQWELEQSISRNAAQIAQDRDRKEEEDWREEWMGGSYGKEPNFESAADSPTSPEVQGAAQLEQDSVEGWATPEVRDFSELDTTREEEEEEEEDEVGEDHIHNAKFQSVSPSTLLDVKSSSEQKELAAKCIQTVVRGKLQLQTGSPSRLPNNEESAARCIQCVYRGFLARRGFRASKGLARLQALANGHTVKRQASIALRCIQALVKVQARSRTKHVQTSLESQAVQKKLMQQLEHEAPPAKKPQFSNSGWCDKVGSAREVEARLLKRQEAAAKREKAKAYALSRQWQAGIRQQPPQQQQQQYQASATPAAVGFHSDKTEWGWNWLERWMAVRPWESQMVDDVSQHRDGARSEEGAAVDVLIKKNIPFICTERKSNSVSGKSSMSSSPSPRKLLDISTASSNSPRTPIKDAVTPRPTHMGSRSFSTPRERSNLSDNINQDKKRLSLPGTLHAGARLLAQTAVKSPRTLSPRTHSPRTQSPRTPQKLGNPRSKLNGTSDVKTTSNLSR